LDVLSSADITVRGSRTGEGLSSPCAVGDFDGDGQQDLAVAAHETTLWNLLGGHGRIYLFRGQKRWPVVLDAARDAWFMLQGTPINSGNVFALADVNGDAKDDLCVTGGSDGTLRIWLGSGSLTGAQTPESAHVVVSGAASMLPRVGTVAAADMDGDGFQDLIVGDPVQGKLHLLYGRHNWQRTGTISSFGGVTLFEAPSGMGSYEMAVEDLGGRGIPEFVFTDPNADGESRPRAGRAWILQPFHQTAIDVRPGYEPNILHYPDGILVVRLPGSRRFNIAEEVLPESVRLASVAPHQHLLRDENGDGIPDLTLHFNTTHMRITPQTTQVWLTARTKSGVPVAGNDRVEVMVKSAAAGKRQNGAREP